MAKITKNQKIALGVGGFAALAGLIAFGTGAGGETPPKKDEPKPDEKEDEKKAADAEEKADEDSNKWEEEFTEEEKGVQEEEGVFLDPEKDKSGLEGNPPNISRNPAGYDPEMFPSFSARRQWYVNLGYPVTVFEEAPIKKSGPNWNAVKRFIRDYNTVAEYAWFVYGQVLQPSGWALQRMGHLAASANPDGKNISNAIQVASELINVTNRSWGNIVNEAKSLKANAEE